jgi:hypothetical protein
MAAIWAFSSANSASDTAAKAPLLPSNALDTAAASNFFMLSSPGWFAGMHSALNWGRSLLLNYDIFITKKAGQSRYSTGKEANRRRTATPCYRIVTFMSEMDLKK